MKTRAEQNVRTAQTWFAHSPEPRHSAHPSKDPEARSAVARGRKAVLGTTVLAFLSAALPWIVSFARAPLAHAQTPAWVYRHPRAADRGSMAYDSVRQKIVLFGAGIPDFGNPWEFDGTTWFQQATSTPVQARQPEQAVFDSARGVFVFPGPIDTYLWDGTTWARRLVSGPSIRSGHAMCFDSIRGVVIDFGGEQSGYLNVQWEWNSVAWTARPASGAWPSPRARHSMAFDAARGVAVLFGGYNGNAFNSETWEWDGASWRIRSFSVRPQARADASMAYDTDRQVCVLFGGGTTTNLTDTWEYDGTSWALRSTSGPPDSRKAKIAYDAARRTMVMVGGSPISASSGQTWTWDGAQWTSIRPVPAWPRANHALAFDRARGRTILFGGEVGSPAVRSGDTWEWDGTRWFAHPGPGPSPRKYHTLAYDSLRRVTVLFGGDAGTPNDETWEWDGAHWSRRSVLGPTARFGHAMAFDPLRGAVVLFGGQNASGTLGDLWLWNGEAWSQRAGITMPGPRSFARMAYSEFNHGILLHGGFLPTGAVTNEVWSWSFFNTHWSGFAPTTSPTEARHTLLFDAARGKWSVFTSSSVYEASVASGTWTPLAILHPGFNNRTLAYDTLRNAAVFFGETNAVAELTGPCVAPNASARPILARSPCPGQRATLAVDAMGSEPRTFQWQRSGASDPIPGATEQTLEIPAFGPADDGSYYCRVENACGSRTVFVRSLYYPPPIQITAHPTSQAGCVTSTVVLSLSATGPQGMVLRWRKDGQPIANATSSTLVLSNLTQADAGWYDCQVFGECESVISNPARLTVCPADFDDGTASGTCDGGVTIDDLLYYITIYAEGFARADIDDGSDTGTPDGGVTIDDLLYYLQRFEVGC